MRVDINYLSKGSPLPDISLLFKVDPLTQIATLNITLEALCDIVQMAQERMDVRIVE